MSLWPRFMLGLALLTAASAARAVEMVLLEAEAFLSGKQS